MSFYSYWITYAILIFRSIVLGYFLGDRSFDVKFFTYINYALGTFLLVMLLLSMWDVKYYSLYIIFIIPIFYGTTIFISFAIIVIIQLNDNVFLKTTVDNGGTRSIGTIHTGDFILHQLPLFEVVLILFLIKDSMLNSFGQFYYSLRSYGKTLYTAYFLLISTFILFVYMINIDFVSNYPTNLDLIYIILLTVSMAIFTELLLFLALVFGSKDKKTSNLYQDNIGYTPITQ